MKKITIRKIKKEDVKETAELLRKLMNYFHSIDDSYRYLPNSNKMEKDIMRLLKGKSFDKDFLIIVAKENDKIIGSCTGEIMGGGYSVFEKIGFIQGFVVNEGYRNKGVGKKLFREITKWFKKRKAGRIELEIEIANKSGAKFWKKIGFSNFRNRAKFSL